MQMARVYLGGRLLSWLPRGKRVRIYSINLMRARHPAWFREDLGRLFELLATGAIRPRVAERISFDEVAEAHRRLEAGGLEGKLVLCPDLPPRRGRAPPQGFTDRVTQHARRLKSSPHSVRPEFDLAQKAEIVFRLICLSLNGSSEAAMIIERLCREHRNIEMLLAVLERELEIFDRGDRPDYEVIRAIISYFELYPELYHHPQEDLVFAKLKIRDPAAAAKVGNLALEHQKGAERLRRVAQAVDSVLADREILRQDVDNIVRDFIEHERRHIMMEDRDFFPAALKALEPQDWTEIASALTSHEDPLFSEAAEETFDALRARILRLEQEAEAERH